MNLSHWLRIKRGRQAELSRYLGIAPPQVSQWISGKKGIPVFYVAKIEAFTGGDVTRKDMRPDDWHVIWPELAEENNEGAAA